MTMYKNYHNTLNDCLKEQIEGQGGEKGLLGGGFPGTGLRRPEGGLHGLPQAHRKHILSFLTKQGYLEITREYKGYPVYKTTPKGVEYRDGELAQLLEQERQAAVQKDLARKDKYFKALKTRIEQGYKNYPEYTAKYGTLKFLPNGYLDPDEDHRDAQFAFYLWIGRNKDDSREKFFHYVQVARGKIPEDSTISSKADQESLELLEKMREKLAKARSPRKIDLYKSFIERVEQGHSLSSRQKEVAENMINPPKWFGR